MKRSLTVIAAVAAVVGTIACGTEHQANVLAPSAAANNAGGPAAISAFSNTPSLIGNWVSGQSAAGFGFASSSLSAAAAISLSSCSNINLNITSQTATQATGTLSMSCPGGIEASGNIVGQLGSSPIPLTWIGSATQGGAACPFSLSGTGTPLGGEYFRLAYSGATCAGTVNGSDDLRFAMSAPPAPGPGPAPAPLAADMIPFGSAIIRNSPMTLASWPITTKITLVDIGPTGVHLDFSKNNGAGRWPDVTPPGWDGPLQWTLGMAMNIGGVWYASAPVQFWHGLERSGGPPSGYALNWFYDPGRWAPMTSHQPRPGEQIGFFACAGDCRNNPGGTLSPVKERSNVVLVTMPGSDAGGRFPF